MSEAAMLEERRRMACDLHDGLAQELACLARSLDIPDADINAETIRDLRRCVERAQLELRRAIDVLTASGRRAVEVSLAEEVSEVAERLGITPEVDCVPGIRLSPARAEALVRIACEAVTNAARHSGADRVSIRLRQDGQRVRMRVSDTGCGFDESAAADGFGLTSMRERARLADGELRIVSAPGQGSTVELSLSTKRGSAVEPSP
jgi:signal transduction histidine kinase